MLLYILLILLCTMKVGKLCKAWMHGRRWGLDHWRLQGRRLLRIWGRGGGGLASNTSYLKSPGSSNFPFSLFPWLLRSLVCQLPLNLHYSRFSGYPGSSSAPSSLVPLVPVVLYFTSFFWFFILLYSLSGSSGSCTVSFSRCHGISWCSVWSHGVGSKTSDGDSWDLMVPHDISWCLEICVMVLVFRGVLWCPKASHASLGLMMTHDVSWCNLMSFDISVCFMGHHESSWRLMTFHKGNWRNLRNHRI